MLIIVDKRISAKAIAGLEKLGEVLPFYSDNITYPAICGHPDVFMCKMPNKLIVAPNAPKYLFDKLKQHNICFKKGEKSVGKSYPDTAIYNAVVTKKYLIHNTNISDKTILHDSSDKEIINIKQGYTRCSLLPVGDESFITSDKGIYKTLKPKVDILLVEPKEITLQDFNNGFFGGIAGIESKTVFFSGDINFLSDKEKIISFLTERGYKIELLSDSIPADVGGIFFLRH
ncbi:MAG: hypothetical protein U9R32_02290 [Bacteroidota bacterium]|nr:hypothetical protein [Bacteroidota bacterium]